MLLGHEIQLTAKETNAKRNTEGNKDFKNLSNTCIWSSYCVLSCDDLKINKIPLEAHSLSGGEGYKLLWYNMVSMY